jgi:DNA-binding MarR family transcriptional regulator
MGDPHDGGEKDLAAADIAKRLDTDPGAMTRILDRMQKKGVIRRVRAADDRRRIHIELTPKGRELAPELALCGISVLNRALEGFTQQEFKQLNVLLGKLVDNVK